MYSCSTTVCFLQTLNKEGWIFGRALPTCFTLSWNAILCCYVTEDAAGQLNEKNSVLKQMGKHSLLASSLAPGAAVGWGWFLSEVLCCLEPLQPTLSSRYWDKMPRRKQNGSSEKLCRALYARAIAVCLHESQVVVAQFLTRCPQVDGVLECESDQREDGCCVERAADSQA